MIKRGFRLWASGFRKQPRCETPKVEFPRCIRFLRATGALRVRVTGYDHATNEFIYTTQYRLWHPLTWLLFQGFCAAEGFLAAPQFFIKAEWRALNG
jgi:hypothetical protein